MGRLSYEQAEQIRVDLFSGMTVRQAAIKHGVSRTTVYDIRDRIAYAHAPAPVVAAPANVRYITQEEVDAIRAAAEADWRAKHGGKLND